MLKTLLRLSVVLFGLLAAPSAWAAACSGTAFAHGTGASPYLWSSTTVTWATTSTSGAPTACTLTAGNAVVFDANTTAGTYDLDASISIASLDTSGMVGGQAGTVFITQNNGQALTVSGATFNLSPNVCYGGGTTTGSCTTPITTARAITFTSTTGTTVITTNAVAGASGVNQLGTVTFNGSGGTFSFADNAILNGNINVTAGTLTAGVANSSPTFTGTLSIAAAGLLTCGTGTWTFSATAGTLLGFAAGATTSCASATLTFSAAAAGSFRQMTMITGQSFGTINISAAGATGPSSFNISAPNAGSETVATLNFTNLAHTFTVMWSSNNTLNVTNAPTTWNGTTGNYLNFFATIYGVTSTIGLGNSAHALTPQYMAFCNMTFTGTGSTVTATNSLDLCGSGSFNGGTISPPASSGGGRVIGG